MELEDVQIRVSNALNKLYEQDSYLLLHDLHERTIAHRLAVYLQDEFVAYHVDCEYNGNCESESGRKIIYTLANKLNTIRLRTQQGDASMPEEIEELRVYPDIIIHKRGENAHNLLVIEIKKSSNRRYQNFDKQKLQAFTSSNCEFQFCFGLFLQIGTLELAGQDTRLWYYK